MLPVLSFGAPERPFLYFVGGVGMVPRKSGGVTEKQGCREGIFPEFNRLDDVVPLEYQ